MPMDRAKYPDNWEAISLQVREEAGNRCEWCAVANGAVGARSLNGIWYDFDDIECISDREIRLLFGCDYPRIIKIVLTVAHLDHDIQNGDRSNLAALCQRCHLNHDRPQHLANAAATRARKRAEAIAAAGQLTLIQEA